MQATNGSALIQLSVLTLLMFVMACLIVMISLMNDNIWDPMRLLVVSILFRLC